MKKKKIPNKKTVTNDEIAYPTRRTVLPFRSGESTSEAHRTRSRSRRPRGGGRRRVEEEEEEEDHHHRGGLLLAPRIVLPLYSVSNGVLFFFLLNPKNPKLNPK